MPGSQVVHRDQFLTNVAIGFSPPGLIADQIGHLIPVKKQSDLYRVFDTEGMRPVADLRAPKATPNKIDWTYSSDSYFCLEHALRAEVTPEEIANADSDLDVFSDAVFRLKTKLKIGLEVAMAALVGTDTNYHADTQITPNPLWDAANTLPAGDIAACHLAVYDKCGYWPNTAVLGMGAYKKIRSTPALLAYFENVQGGLLTHENIKNLLDVDRVLIGGSQQITTKKGQTDTRAAIWSDDTIEFLYISPNLASKTDPSSVGIFNWTGPHGGNSNITIERWWNQDNKVHVIDAMWHWDIKVLAEDANNDILTGGIIDKLWT